MEEEEKNKKKRVYIYSQVPVNVKLSFLRAMYSSTEGVRLPTNCSSENVTCVSMLAHPFNSDNNGTMDTTTVVHIMVVAPGYTVYKGREEGEPLGSEFEEWRVAETDSYNLYDEIVNNTPGVYKKIFAKPVHFLSEAEANQYISSDLLTKSHRTWYNNSHGVIDQFVFRSGLKHCHGCRDGLSGRLFLNPDNNRMLEGRLRKCQRNHCW